MFISIPRNNIRRLDTRILLLIAIIQPITSIIVNYLFSVKFFTPFSLYTHHLLNATLQANLLILLLWWLFIFRLGKHNVASLWLDSTKLKVALKWGMAYWLILQMLAVIYLAAMGEPLAWHPHINREFGNLIGQLFGNALNEELIFRGIFFLQIYLILKDRGALSDGKAFLLAMVLSQLFFAVIHLPNRLLVKHTQDLVADQIRLFLMGCLFVLLYVRTRNLALNIVIHALINYPFRILQVQFPYQLVLILLFLITLIFYGKFHPHPIPATDDSAN